MPVKAATENSMNSLWLDTVRMPVKAAIENSMNGLWLESGCLEKPQLLKEKAATEIQHERPVAGHRQKPQLQSRGTACGWIQSLLSKTAASLQLEQKQPAGNPTLDEPRRFF